MHTMIAALVLAACPALAADLASPQTAGVPALSVTLERAAVGDYLKFRLTQTAGPQSQTLTMWHEHRALADGIATVRTVFTNRSYTTLEPITVAADDVEIGEGQVPVTSTLIDVTLPPELTLVSDVIAKLPDERVDVGARTFTCSVFERTTKLSVPQGEFKVVNRVWWSADAPLSGLVRNESTTTGIQQGSSLTELVAFTGMNDPSKVVVESPRWFLAQARFALPALGVNDHDRDRILEKLGDAYLAHDDLAAAHALLPEFRSGVYRDTLFDAIRCFAAIDDRPGQRELVGLTEPDNVESFCNRLPNSYGNAIESLTDAETEKLVAGRDFAAWKDVVWARRFWRALVDGDRERARSSFARISTDLGRSTAIGSAAYEASRLTRVDLLDLAASFDPKAAQSPSFLGSHYALLDEVGREKEAREVSRRYVDAIVALPEDERITTEIGVYTLALYRPWSRVEPFVVADLGARRASADPEADLAKARAEGSTFGGVGQYAQRAAARGDGAAAQRILATQTDLKSTDCVTSVIALYHAGKKDEAAAWAAALEAGRGEHEFYRDGSRARIQLGFAAAECFAGDAAADARWLDEAEKSARAAHEGMTKFNRENDASLYWSGGLSLKSSAPFFLVGIRLVARGEHARALELAKATPSSMPASGCAEDFWKYLAVEAGKRGDAEYATRVTTEMNSRVSDANTRQWTVRNVARSFAVGGHVDAGRAFLASITDAALRDSATAPFVVQLAIQRRVDEAESVFRPWIEGQDPKQWADPKVALSYANAVAGRFERARELFTNARFTSNFGGMGGLERQTLLVSLGYHAARAKPDLVELGRWIVAIPDDHERALVSIGMAMGLGKRPVPDEFVDPLSFLEL